MGNDKLNQNLGETGTKPEFEQNNKSNDFSGESVFLMTLLGLGTVGFCYLVYLMIF